jgi:transposase-like protein
MADYYNGDGLLKISNTLYRQYNYLPFKKVIWTWIHKYTDAAVKLFEKNKPGVGSVWEFTITPLMLVSEEQVWVYHVTDTKTRFLLASYASEYPSPHAASIVFREARERAGRYPQTIIIDPSNPIKDKITSLLNCQIVHGETRLLVEAEKAGIKKIERFHAKIRDKVKVVCAFKSLKTLTYFNTGWAIHYNYFKPLSLLNGKTPAEAAGIKYGAKSWADIIGRSAAVDET